MPATTCHVINDKESHNKKKIYFLKYIIVLNQ